MSGLTVIVDPCVAQEDPQGLEEARRVFDGPLELLQPALEPGDRQRLGRLDDAEAIVVLGSAASVHDRFEWLTDLAEALKGQLAESGHASVLGICFGHQLIAHLLGGRVDWVHPDRAKILGPRSTTFRDSSLLPAQTLKVIASHREHVVELPERLQATAFRDHSPNDAFEDREGRIFGVQFHPEAREEFARQQSIDPEAVDTEIRRDGRKVLEAFAESLRRRTATSQDEVSSTRQC